MTTDHRLESGRAWLKSLFHPDQFELAPISGDASFRRYFRVLSGGRTLVFMDAPPQQEDSRPFTNIAGRLREAGLHAPEILHFDHLQGFGLLEDLGDQLYRDILSPRTVETCFPPLFEVLREMVRGVDASALPDYDDHLLRQELDYFPDWFLGAHKKRSLSESEKGDWESLCSKLLESAAEQPRCFVHRDFHSSNLLRSNDAQPGIIDFQDAVRGPLSYDFISLLWDRHITWPRDRLEHWMQTYRDMLEIDSDTDTWIRWCDWMGLQRNFKIVGIFARLHYRDGKRGYLEMIPRFHGYLLDVLPRYDDLRRFRWILEDPTCAP